MCCLALMWGMHDMCCQTPLYSYFAYYFPKPLVIRVYGIAILILLSSRTMYCVFSYSILCKYQVKRIIWLWLHMIYAKLDIIMYLSSYVLIRVLREHVIMIMYLDIIRLWYVVYPCKTFILYDPKTGLLMVQAYIRGCVKYCALWQYLLWECNAVYDCCCMNIAYIRWYYSLLLWITGCTDNVCVCRVIDPEVGGPPGSRLDPEFFQLQRNFHKWEFQPISFINDP